MTRVFDFLGVIILCIMLPIAYLGLQFVQYDEYQQFLPAVTLDNSTTTRNVVLAELPDPNRASAIKSVKSSLYTDIAVVDNYTETSKLLTVGGLTPGATRNLTITYQIESPFFASLPFLRSAITVVVYLLMLGIVVIVIAVLVSAFRRS